jgi:prepilin-type N-terminal cleavage/methylation domain-containing protein
MQAARSLSINMSLASIQQHTLMDRRGFSLIEVLVSLSIFTIVMTISVGVLMVLIGANAQAQNTQSIMTNLTFALDSITRELRTGSDYYCGSSSSLPTSGANTRNCASGGDAISFNEGGRSLTDNASSRRIAIRLNNGTIERRLGNGDGDGNANEAEDWSALTSPDIVVTNMSFYVTGATRGDNKSPTATIYIEGIAGVEDGSEGRFHVQTTVVQQLLDI